MASRRLALNPLSLSGAAATLHDLAGDLRPGQPDRFLFDWADHPRSHPDVAKAMRAFGEFAHDQYQDAIALLAALSTRVDAAKGVYLETDQEAAKKMTEFLTNSTYRPADQRPA